MERSTLQRSLFAFVLVVIVIVTAALLFGILTSTPPTTAGQGTLWLFFTCLWLLLTVSFGSAWHYLRKVWFHRSARVAKYLISLRQAGLAAAVVIICLVLNSLDLFQIWDAFPLLTAAILIEFFFQAEKQPIASLRNERISS